MDEHSSVTPSAVVRDYASADHVACRSLWVELVAHHRRLYGDDTIGGVDPGPEFDAYLAAPERLTSWVAVAGGQVVGLAGLLGHGGSAEIEPVVVATSFRGRGVGRLLVDHGVSEARDRGFEYVTLRPVARNLSAIRRFHQAGFRTLGGHVDLTLDLTERRHDWLTGARLHGLDFRY